MNETQTWIIVIIAIYGAISIISLILSIFWGLLITRSKNGVIDSIKETSKSLLLMPLVIAGLIGFFYLWTIPEGFVILLVLTIIGLSGMSVTK